MVRDLKFLAPHRMQAAGGTYLTALTRFADPTPMLIPVLESLPDAGTLLDAVDGLFLPGSPSNVDPARYGGAEPRAGTLPDRRRDAASFDPIRGALARGRPSRAAFRAALAAKAARPDA